MTTPIRDRSAGRSLRQRLILKHVLPLLLTGGCLFAHAQVNDVGQKPYLGWSSFSEQTINGSFLTQANISTQSDALASSGIQAHGFRYINIDSGWMGSFDGNGRPIPNTTTFPDIKALIDHIHQNGQKAGIYWTPGVEQPAVQANYPILGTQYHIQDILTVPYTAGNAFGGPGTAKGIACRVGNGQDVLNVILRSQNRIVCLDSGLLDTGSPVNTSLLPILMDVID